MYLSELKKYIGELPDEFDSFDLVNGEYAILLEEEGEEKLIYRKDMPIQIINIDKESNEIVFLHQTELEIDKIRTE